MTPEQQQLLASDPSKFWESIHKQQEGFVSELIKSSLNGMVKLHRDSYGQLATLALLQSKELSIFRTLETHIRNSSLTEEALSAIVRELDEFRVASQSGAIKI